MQFVEKRNPSKIPVDVEYAPCLKWIRKTQHCPRTQPHVGIQCDKIVVKGCRALINKKKSFICPSRPARQKFFNPHGFGLLGTYWRCGQRPLNGIICSSIGRKPGRGSWTQASYTRSRRGLIFQSLSLLLASAVTVMSSTIFNRALRKKKRSRVIFVWMDMMRVVFLHFFGGSVDIFFVQRHSFEHILIDILAEILRWKPAVLSEQCYFCLADLVALV